MTPASQSRARLLTALVLSILTASTALILSRKQNDRRRSNTRRSTTSPRHPRQAGSSSTTAPSAVRGVQGLIGNTPLMRIQSLSDLTHCEILGKCEFLNPAGSPKDRVALQILLDAEAASLISPNIGDCIFEGTVGSTGISIATLCRAKGYRCSIVLPDDVAIEKSQLLQNLGAEVKKVRPRAIVDKRHFVNEARALAGTFAGTSNQRSTVYSATSTEAGSSTLFVELSDVTNPSNGTAKAQPHRPPRGFFADQFESTSNFTAHFNGTGPEIWAQCGGSTLQDIEEDDDDAPGGIRQPQLDIFVAGAGTGGTLSGVAAAFRQREEALRRSAFKWQVNKKQWDSGTIILRSLWRSLAPWLGLKFSHKGDESAFHPPISPIRIVLADPQGSGLFNRVKHGVLYSPTEAEGTRRRHQVDTIVEGIGMNRITKNLSLGIENIDDAIRVTDEEAIRISRWMSVRDGLFLGSSSAVNVVAAVKSAIQLREQWNREGRAGRPTVVTILCDSGVRHLSKFHNDEVLAKEYGIHLPEDSMDIDISDMLTPS